MYRHQNLSIRLSSVPCRSAELHFPLFSEHWELPSSVYVKDKSSHWPCFKPHSHKSTKLHSQEQVMSWLWLTGHSLLTPHLHQSAGIYECIITPLFCRTTGLVIVSESRQQSVKVLVIKFLQVVTSSGNQGSLAVFATKIFTRASVMDEITSSYWRKKLSYTWI